MSLRKPGVVGSGQRPSGVAVGLQRHFWSGGVCLCMEVLPPALIGLLSGPPLPLFYGIVPCCIQLPNPGVQVPILESSPALLRRENLCSSDHFYPFGALEVRFSHGWPCLSAVLLSCFAASCLGGVVVSLSHIRD